MPRFEKNSTRSYSDACKHDWKHGRQDYHNSSQAFHRGRDSRKSPLSIDPQNTIGTGKYDQIIIFGDSLSDQGNLSKALGGAFPPFPYFQGRFSNGPLWIDQFVPKLGLKSTQVLNFAFAGATTGRLNVGEQLAGVTLPFKLPGLLDEVDRFTALINPTGTNSNGANPKALYVVFAGANDFLTLPPTLFPGLAVGNLESFIGLYGAIVQSVKNVAMAVTNLALQGAGTIAVANLPDLGRTPLPIQQGTSLVATAFSIGFNVILEKTLEQLQGALRSKALKVDIVQVDLFSVGEAVAKNPQKFGFTNLTTPLITNLTAPNPQGFFYWDDFHPTTQVHTLIANAFEQALSKPTGSKVLETSLERVTAVLNNGQVRPIVQSLLAQAGPLLTSSGLDNLFNKQPLTV